MTNDEPVAPASPHSGVRRALLRRWLPDRFHCYAQPLARRYDQARPRPLQLAHWQMGMGRAAERTDGVGSAMIRTQAGLRSTCRSCRGCYTTPKMTLFAGGATAVDVLPV